MKSRFHITSGLYAQMLDRLNEQYLTDKLGFQRDLTVFENDQWLCDSAVIERLEGRKGVWDIVLVFADPAVPTKFLTRKITSHTCPKRAAQMAVFMRRLAAKDQRGTICISPNQFYHPPN